MVPVVLWGLLVLLHQFILVTLVPVVSAHSLGRPPSPSDLSQLKSLLERFEESLSEGTPVQDRDYEGAEPEPEPEPELRPSGRGGAADLVGDEDPGPGRGWSPRSRLQDLLLTSRRRSSGCFGGRMDRIGNASGLGCNNGRG